MRKILFLMLLVFNSVVLAQARDPAKLYAVIDTSQGSMEFVLYPEAAPLTVSNFVNLAMRGFYDGLTFHRVIKDFMIQGGDPAGNGSGGPGYEFEDEIILKLNQEGILAMANAGPATNGSQFFITHQATPHLNGLHTVFGLVTSGKEIIRKIRRDDVINSITIEGDAKPLLERYATRLAEWNQILDSKFPDLKPAPLASPRGR